MERGWGMTRGRRPGFHAPCFGSPWGSGEQVGEIHQHLAPAKGSGNFWPAQVYTYAASLYVVKVKMFILP